MIINNSMKLNFNEIVFGCIILALFTMFAIMSTSCSRKVVTVVERHDSIQVREVRDTLRLTERDSVVIQTKGDTVFVEKYKTLFRDRVTERVDTIKDVTQIPVIKEVPMIEPYPLKNKLINAGIGFLFAILLGIVVSVISVVIKYKG